MNSDLLRSGRLHTVDTDDYTLNDDANPMIHTDEYKNGFNDGKNDRDNDFLPKYDTWVEEDGVDGAYIIGYIDGYGPKRW